MSVYPRRDCLVIETKKTFDMKKYVIIQLVKLVPFLVIGISIFWFIIDSGEFLFLAGELLWMEAGLVEHDLKRIIALAVDLFLGTEESVVCFKKICSNEHDDEFSKRHFYEWFFYYGANSKLYLTIPTCL